VDAQAHHEPWLRYHRMALLQEESSSLTYQTWWICHEVITSSVCWTQRRVVFPLVINQRLSPWKLNVRSCRAVLPLRTLLGLNPGTAMHMRRNSVMDETTPSDKGAFGQIQPSQQSRSSLGRCSTSSFPGSRCTAPALQDVSPVHHISSTRTFGAPCAPYQKRRCTNECAKK